MFIQILEGLHPLDAEILCLVKDKKLYDKYKITKANVTEAYPDIVWGIELMSDEKIKLVFEKCQRDKANDKKLPSDFLSLVTMTIKNLSMIL